jgi:50S ribosomal protein L16 3-hydroxylase
MQDKLNQEQLTIAGMYEDADLCLQEHAAEISTDMVTKVAAILRKIHWSNNEVADFLGTYLSEPKPDVVFDVNKKISLSNFTKSLAKYGITLDLKSQMLFTGNTFYLNGEAITLNGDSAKMLTRLADLRTLSPDELNYSQTADEVLLKQLHEWYLAGFLHFNV